jgi:tripartite-type tricarboxylate transporter receptor subunit TctC
MRPARRTLLAALPALALPGVSLPGVSLPGPARAQTSAHSPWPDRPVRILVPFAAGSTPDIAARTLAPHFQQAFGQPFVVENRPGAGGAIATEAVARATDGHTIGVSIGGPASTARILNPALGYDPVADLAPLAYLVRMPVVLAVHPSVPARTMAEFMAHAKANPGRLNYGSIGAGTIGHLVMADLAARHGLDMTHVVFRSVPQSVTEIVAGRIEAMAAVTAAVLGQVKGEQVRALGISSEQRFAAASGIATFTEQGEGPAIWTWIGLFGPASMPGDRVARLGEEATRALATAEARRVLEAAGFEVVAGPPAALRAQIGEDMERWGGLIRRLGIRVDS